MEKVLLRQLLLRTRVNELINAIWNANFQSLCWSVVVITVHTCTLTRYTFVEAVTFERGHVGQIF